MIRAKAQMSIQEILNQHGNSFFHTNLDKHTPVYGVTQKYETPVCEIHLHRLPAGTQLIKETYHLPRMFFAIRGTVQMYDRTNYQSKIVDASQSLLIHSYTHCQGINESSEEAWLVEFSFFTMEALPAPAVRTVMPWQQPFAQNTLQFQMPDWVIQLKNIDANDIFSMDVEGFCGYVLQIDRHTGESTLFEATDVQTIDGGTSGKILFLANGTPDLW